MYDNCIEDTYIPITMHLALYFHCVWLLSNPTVYMQVSIKILIVYACVNIYSEGPAYIAYNMA